MKIDLPSREVLLRLVQIYNNMIAQLHRPGHLPAQIRKTMIELRIPEKCFTPRSRGKYDAPDPGEHYTISKHVPQRDIYAAWVALFALMRSELIDAISAWTEGATISVEDENKLKRVLSTLTYTVNHGLGCLELRHHPTKGFYITIKKVY